MMVCQVLNKPSADYLFTLRIVLTQRENIKKFPTGSVTDHHPLHSEVLTPQLLSA